MYTDIKEELRHYAKMYLKDKLPAYKGIRIIERIALKYDKEPKQVLRMFFHEVDVMQK